MVTELYYYSDGSDGYGQSIYGRFVNADGKAWCSFVIIKARVAPIH